MLKVVGLLLIIAVGGIIGVRASESLRLRKYKFSQFYLFIGEIEDMMRLGTELEQIYKTEKANELLSVSGYSVKLREEGLSAEDKSFLSEFFSKLGMGDLRSGLALCETYREILSERVTEAEREVASKARLYSLFGVFSGIFIAILLV